MELGRSNLSVAAVRTSGGGFAARVTTEAVAMYVTLTTLQHGGTAHENRAFRCPKAFSSETTFANRHVVSSPIV